MQNQAYIFTIFILNGLLIGILFDVFRILRKSFKTPDFITYIQDIAFWLVSGLLLLYSIFKFNNGELRLFIFLGVVLGNFLYMLVFSKLFINISVSIINITKKICYITIVVPIKYIIMFAYRPIKFISTKFVKLCVKIMQFCKQKSKKMKLKNVIYKNKKDFA